MPKRYRLRVLVMLLAVSLLTHIGSLASDTQTLNLGDQAQQQLVQKVALYQSLAATSHSQLRMRMTSDPLVKSVAVMDQGGQLMYPQPGQIGHVSDHAVLDDQFRLRQLVSRMSQDTSIWERRDLDGDELYFCHAQQLTVCLFVVTDELAQLLNTDTNQLLVSIGHGEIRTALWQQVLMVALVFVGGSLLAAAVWRVRQTAHSGRGPVKSNELTARDGGFIMADMLVEPRLKRVTRGPLHCAINDRDLTILSYLQQRPNEVIGKDELYDAAWGRDFVPSSRALEQHIINLRRKLDPKRELPVIIETVHGQGYRFSSTD